MKLEYDVCLIDAVLTVPTTNYDDKGNEIPWSEGEHEKLLEEAKGKFVVQIVGTLSDWKQRRIMSPIVLPECLPNAIQDGLHAMNQSAGKEIMRCWKHIGLLE